MLVMRGSFAYRVATHPHHYHQPLGRVETAAGSVHYLYSDIFRHSIAGKKRLYLSGVAFRKVCVVQKRFSEPHQKNNRAKSDPRCSRSTIVGILEWAHLQSRALAG